MQNLYLVHVCAWCKCIYDDQGKRLIKLDEEDYKEYPSHGICLQCKTELLSGK